MSRNNPNKIDVVGSLISEGRSCDLVDLMISWAQDRKSRYVCVANVHMTMEAHWSPEFRKVLLESDLAVPDGMPLVWMMRLLGAPRQERMAGLDILVMVCEEAQKKGLSIYFLGSTPEVLLLIKNRIEVDFPNLRISGLESPPFRPLSEQEDLELVDRINASGANIVFVALGCPKQEKWMADNRGRISAVMIGLGGAFPVYAGIAKRAPAPIRNAGLEWLFRLVQEPRRLLSRYWKTNIPFLWLCAIQLQKKIAARSKVVR